MSFTIGEIVTWNSPDGPVTAEYRGTIGKPGLAGTTKTRLACIAAQSAPGAWKQLRSVPLRQLRKVASS